VPRGFEGGQTDSAELQEVLIFQRLERVIGLSAGAEVDSCPGAVPEFKMPGQEVGMEMGKHNMANLKPVPPSIFQVLVNVPLRIDHNRSAAVLVPNQIGGVGEAAQVILFKDHNPLLSVGD
jgi:hypothetical protein